MEPMQNEIAPLTGFNALTPDTVIDLVEKAMDVRLTSLSRPLSSYINRVFEMQVEEGPAIIAKFYRPGRWSRLALQDEHDFLLELDEREIPVIAPLRLADGGTLGEYRGMFFALFPKRSGRRRDEPTDDEWEQLGRLMARVHAVGALHQPRERITLRPDSSTRSNVEYILRSGMIPQEMRREYEAAANEMITLVTPLFEDVEMIRIHGDCHWANIIFRPDEGFYLIDFDDMAIGPPVQDFWMLLPGYSQGTLLEIDLFLEGYNTFRSFDRRTLRLIEPLRAMRFIHFTAWCAAQAGDGTSARLAPGWGTPNYWRTEINDLKRQCDEIVSLENFFWGM